MNNESKFRETALLFCIDLEVRGSLGGFDLLANKALDLGVMPLSFVSVCPLKKFPGVLAYLEKEKKGPWKES